MRSVHAIAVCSLVVAAVALPAVPAAALTPDQKVVAAVNKARARHGIHQLRVSRTLELSSHRYAVWMLRNDYFGHRSRISASHRFRRLGEALGLHPGWRARWRRMFRAWMRSPSHRRILMSRRFTWIGVGFARGAMGRGFDTTWVVHVGRP